MHLHRLALALAASLLATAAQAIEVGDCSSDSAIMEILARLGQRVLVDAQQPAGRATSRLRITGNQEGSLGFVLSGGAKVCVHGRVTNIRSDSHAAPDPRDVVEANAQCGRGRHARAMCGPPRVTRLNKVGRSEVLAALHRRARPVVPAIEEWRSAEFGFCTSGIGQLMLCTATHAPASGM